MSSEGIEYAIYVEGKLPESFDDIRVISKEKVFGNWWKLIIKVDKKEDLPNIAKKLRDLGLKVADSPFLQEYFYI